MTSPLKDPRYEHRAHVVCLTVVRFTADGPGSPPWAAQCTGRIGWTWGEKKHDFMELYRGYSEDEAKAVCAEHNAAEHTSHSASTSDAPGRVKP